MQTNPITHIGLFLRVLKMLLTHTGIFQKEHRGEQLFAVHPEKKISCMSAYCIDVAKLAEKCGLEFAWVPEKLFLFGMFVFL